MLGFLLGNGDAVKLLRSLVFVIIFIALFEIFFSETARRSQATPTRSSARAPEVLLGVTKPQNFPGLALAGIAALRYIMIACLVSILIKRLSRR